MHQDAALWARLCPATSLGGSYCAAGATDELRTFSFVRKCGGVLKHKNRSIGRGKTPRSSLEMSTQNVMLTDAIIVHESIGCLGIGPILARKRNALTHTLP